MVLLRDVWSLVLHLMHDGDWGKLVHTFDSTNISKVAVQFSASQFHELDLLGLIFVVNDNLRVQVNVQNCSRTTPTIVRHRLSFSHSY